MTSPALNVSDLPRRRLFDAASSGNLSVVKKIIKHGQPGVIRSRDARGETALHKAIADGNKVGICSLGVYQQIKGIKLGYATTPIMLACALAKLEFLNVLLEEIDDINLEQADDRGRTAIFYCSGRRQIECFIQLVRVGSSVDVIDKFGLTPLHIAAQNGQSALCEHLIRSRCCVDCYDPHGCTPLHYASYHGHVPTINVLIKAGASVASRQSTDGGFPIHKAAEAGKRAAVEALIKGGDTLARQTDDGGTVLHSAAACGHVALCRWLIEHGIPAHMEDMNGLTPIMLASGKGFSYCATSMQAISKKVSSTAPYIPFLPMSHFQNKENLRKSDKMQTLEESDVENITVLFREPVPEPVDMRANTGGSKLKSKKKTKKKGKKKASINTAALALKQLGLAANVQREDQIELQYKDKVARAYAERNHLFSRTYRPHCHYLEDDEHWYHVSPPETYTNLYNAAKNGDLRTIRKAMKLGINLNTRNKAGRTALMAAANYSQTAIMEYLLDHGADVHIEDPNKWTALHFACNQGHMETSKILVHHGADINAQSCCGGTPLMRAADNGFGELVSLILMEGGNANQINEAGHTAADLADQWGLTRLSKAICERMASTNSLSPDVMNAGAFEISKNKGSTIVKKGKKLSTKEEPTEKKISPNNKKVLYNDRKT